MKPISALKRPPSLHVSVQESLRSYIAENHLEAGAPLPAEGDLAQQLGVSRNSVRESIKALESVGVLEVRRGSGVFVKAFSFEPLLGPVGDVDLQGVAWAIVGGESGPRARPMDESWARQIRDICERDDVAFFFKQWGSWGADGIKRSKRANGFLLNGSVRQEFPMPLRRKSK